MKKIVINTPCTFFSNDCPVKILDSDKNLFYFHPNNQKSINFNLPVGKYFTKNNLIQKSFTPYTNFNKPNFKINPASFKIIISENLHKATINSSDKTIIIDKSIAYHKYKPVPVFILGHEVAHLIFGGDKYNGNEKIFNAESACDLFANEWMLSIGYNPTQIKLAAKLALKDGYRNACIHNETINKNFRK